MHGLCTMSTKTISLELGAYQLLKREKLGRESFSQAVRRIINDRPALTAGELEEAMKPLIGYGAGPKRKKRRAAA